MTTRAVRFFATSHSSLKSSQKSNPRARELMLAAATVVTFAWSSAAFAHGDVECKEPKAEWRPQMELQRKLTSEGWKVRQVKTDQGCYEVYGFYPNGKRAEVYFNPKTFEKVAEVDQKDD